MLTNNIKCSNCGSYHDPTLEQCPKCYKRNELYDRERVLNNVFFFHPIAHTGLFLAGFAYVGMLFSEIICGFFLLTVPEGTLRTTLAVFFTYLLMFGGLLTVVLTTRRKPFLKRYTRGLDYAFGAVYAIGIVVTSLLISFIVSLIYKGPENVNQSVAVEISTNYPILACFVLCLFGPICEELTYRVGLYSLLRRVHIALALAVTTIVFALIHFDFAAEDIVSELWSLPTYISSAVILTLAYEHRGPACSMTAHLLYNTFAFIMIFVEKYYG